MTVELHRVLLAHVANLLNPITSISNVTDLEQRLYSIGWDLDALTGFDTGAVVSAVDSVAQTIADIVAQIEAGGPDELLEYAEAATELGFAAGQIFAAFQDYSPPTGIDETAVELLLGDIAIGLLDAYVATVAPRLTAVLELLGLVRREPADELTRSDGQVVRRAMVRASIDLDMLGKLLTDPVGVLVERFRDDPAAGRRAAEAIADIAGPELVNVLQGLGAVAGYGVPSPARGFGLTPDELVAAQRVLVVETPPPADPDDVVQESFRLVVGLTDDTAGQGLGLALAPSGELTLRLGSVTITIAGDLDALLVTGSGIRFASTTPGLHISLTLAYAPTVQPDSPMVRFGSATGTRFQVGAITGGVGVDFDTANPDEPDLSATVDLTGVVLAVSGGDGDGFLQKALPPDAIYAEVNLGVDWSLRGGFRFRGSGRFVIQLPARFSLGPIEILGAVLILDLSTEGVTVILAISVSVALGPFQASVEGIGLQLALAPPAGGPPDGVAVSFKPPDGAGMVIDASVVTGGGYLLMDHKQGKYAGILQLEIQDTIAITAIGLITTKKPDGSPGFSLLVIITAEFPPIQLGYGFTLNGVGGLIGANRTMALDVLRAGVRTRALDAILFPKDPVAKAPQIIATLESVFPQAQGRFVIGLMVAIGWGSTGNTSLLVIEVGILIEIPLPIRLVIIGRISLVLPTDEAAVLSLKMDVVGILDFDRKEISIDAAIYDSRVAAFTISGDMAMRLSWGEAPVFALSAGGFNPRYDPPPGFPELNRLAISLADSENPRLRLEAYFATTSNSLQIGAKLDMYASMDVPILGLFSASAYLGFDALLYLSPRFHFIIDIYGGAEILLRGKPLFSAHVTITLSGPQPWHAVGEARFEFFGKHHIEFDVTIGEDPALTALPAVDPLADLLAALADPRNWSAQLPTDGHGIVTIRSIDAPGELLAHPLGRLGVAQRVLPLDVELELYGGVAPPADRRFTISEIVVGTAAAVGGNQTRAAFAPGQFLDLTEDEKLSRPAFEQLPNGRDGIGFAAAANGDAVPGGVAYDTVIVDAADRVATVSDYTLHGGLVDMAVATGAAAHAPLASTGTARYAGDPLGIAVDPPGYRVASTDDLTGDGTVYPSYLEADLAKAGRSGRQVVGAHEGAGP
jgi:hypothetical protein